METEVKLAFKDKNSLYSAASSDWFKAFCTGGDGAPVTLENSYLDTSSRDLLSRGAVFRKRHYIGEDKDSYEFTVKVDLSSVGGVSNRYEWNVKSEGPVITSSEFLLKAQMTGDDPKILEDLLMGIEVKDLTPLCSNSFERILLGFKYGESVMEACVDYGEIKDSEGNTCDIICEMELELIEGTLSDLEAAKTYIISKTGSEPFDIGKFARTFKASGNGGGK